MNVGFLSVYVRIENVICGPCTSAHGLESTAIGKKGSGHVNSRIIDSDLLSPV